MADKERIKAMRIMATNIRIATIRQMMSIGFGHIGGSMSIADVLGVLYGGEMKVDPKKPAWPERDKLVCSKGHAGPAVYAALAIRGFFPDEWLETMNKGGTNLPSHCDMNKTPGIDMTTGSLGQGLSSATGLALAAAANGYNCYTYCIMGDGECDEGNIWEAAMAAAHYKLDHLIGFIDNNGLQIDGTIAMVNDIANFGERFSAFRWNAYEVDGHNIAEIAAAIEKAKANPGKPSLIVLKTIKGKGCQFVEKGYNHHIPMPREQCEEEIARLRQEVAEIEKE
jgi:transketolase